MQNIDIVLNENAVRVGILLRKYRIIGAPTISTIKKAFEQKGERFMLELLEILVPDNSSFGDLIAPKTGLIQSAPIDTKTLAVSSFAQPTEQNKNGGFWGFWEKLLSGVNSTGQTIDQFKQDIASKPIEYSSETNPTNPSNPKLIYMVAAGFIVLIVLILILRK
jgi:hypothetical protein